MGRRERQATMYLDLRVQMVSQGSKVRWDAQDSQGQAILDTRGLMAHLDTTDPLAPPGRPGPPEPQARSAATGKRIIGENRGRTGVQELWGPQEVF
ncbi:unnamed protein product [Boreogadus saida]